MQQRIGACVTRAAMIISTAVLGGHLISINYAIILGGLLFAAVILPAVWSSRPDRRRDARAVLRLLLQIPRRPPRRLPGATTTLPFRLPT